MKHFKIVRVGIFGLLTLAFASMVQAAEAPVKIGNQLACTGEIDGSSGDILNVVLQNSDSFRPTENTAPPTQVTINLKSHTQGGQWFAIIPSTTMDPTRKQLFWIYRTSQNTSKLLAKGGFTAKLALSAGRPRLEIIVDPRLKFDIFMEAGEGNNVKTTGYLALKTPSSSEPIVAQELICQIEPAVRQP